MGCRVPVQGAARYSYQSPPKCPGRKKRGKKTAVRHGRSISSRLRALTRTILSGNLSINNCSTCFDTFIGGWLKREKPLKSTTTQCLLTPFDKSIEQHSRSRKYLSSRCVIGMCNRPSASTRAACYRRPERMLLKGLARAPHQCSLECANPNVDESSRSWTDAPFHASFING